MQHIRVGLIQTNAWLLRLPAGIWWLVAATSALNLASNLGNSLGSAPHFGGPFVALGMFLAYLLFFAMMLRAIRSAQSPPHHQTTVRAGTWYSILLAIVALWGIVTAAQALPVITTSIPRDLASPARYGSDEMYDAHYNALLVLHGENPYAGDRLAPLLRAFETTSITPLRRPPYTDPLRPPSQAATHAIVAGYLADPAAPHPQIAPETTHSYPALSFLLAIPAVWAGLPTIGGPQVLALLLGIIGLIALAPRRWRVPVAVLGLMDVDGIRSVAGSDFAIWTAVGVGMAWWLLECPSIVWAPQWDAPHTARGPRDHGWRDRLRAWPWSAVVMGLACAVQQTVWFFAPFWLVRLWHRAGWREALRSGAIAVAAFALVNLPFFLGAPGPWLRSLFLPMTLPLFPTGGGFVALGLGGALPLFPPIAYTVTEFTVYALLLGGYAWRGRALPLAGLILPLVAVVFAWRSPSRYFILLPYLALLGWLITWRTTKRSLVHTRASIEHP